MHVGDTSSAESIVDAEQLRAFAAFAETLNFTHAADRIGLSQPALHERVRRLGERLGVTLYRRKGRSLTLTAEGLEVAAFARRNLAESAALVARLRGQEMSRGVCLAAGEGSYLFLLGPPLRGFPHPLEPLVLGGPDALDAVRSGRADLGVGVFDVVPRGLSSRRLCTAPTCAALPRGHRLARKQRVRLADLSEERLILAPEGQKHRDIVGRAVAAVGAEVGPDPIEADGWSLMLAFTAMGLGVAIVNGVCPPPEGTVLRPLPELGRVTYRLVRRADAPPSPAVDDLARRIEEHLAGAIS